MSLLRCLLMLTVAAAALVAQSGTATINGTVNDPSSAAHVGARVVIRNPDTGFTRTTMTNEQGVYQMPGLRVPAPTS